MIPLETSTIIHKNQSGESQTMKNEESFRGISATWQYFASGKISFCEKFFVTAFVLIYIISPIDLIPDIPIVGWIDDIGIGALFLAYCSWRVNSKNSDESKSLTNQDGDLDRTSSK